MPPVFSHSLGVSLGFHYVAVSSMVTTTTKNQGSLCVNTQELLWQYDPIPFPECVGRAFSRLLRVCGNSTDRHCICEKLISAPQKDLLLICSKAQPVCSPVGMTCGCSSNNVWHNLHLHFPDRSVINLHCDCLSSPPEQPFTRITF